MFDAPSASRPPPPLGQKFVLASPDLSPPGGSHARHDDEFPFDAPDHPGAFRENLSPRRNCVAQAGTLQDGRERSEEHTSELQSLTNLVCRLLLEKKKKDRQTIADKRRA